MFNALVLAQGAHLADAGAEHVGFFGRLACGGFGALAFGFTCLRLVFELVTQTGQVGQAELVGGGRSAFHGEGRASTSGGASIDYTKAPHMAKRPMVTHRPRCLRPGNPGAVKLIPGFPDVVLHVAGGEHARDVGGRGHAVQAALRADVARVVHVELAAEDVGVRLVADGDEHASHLDLFDLAFVLVRALQAGARHAGVVAQDLVEDHVGLDLDLALLLLLMQAVDQDRLGAELVAAVDERDLAGDVGQVQRFFHGGVAATHHGHFLALVEEAVARCAGGHAAASKGFFRRQPQILGRSAGGDDQRVAALRS
ncbi:hypothetical protein COLO4_02517 [Corchorus olitorius]|uniref:Uncharacterized protein n=1 Tax=Corchorus olitorius TaxID=93759 RepID=A0A1R3L0T5_9ROSI|nr:hypothetical protein COLO4_02517 [Corchorus olitorius]